MRSPWCDDAVCGQEDQTGYPVLWCTKEGSPWRGCQRENSGHSGHMIALCGVQIVSGVITTGAAQVVVALVQIMT